MVFFKLFSDLQNQLGEKRPRRLAENLERSIFMKADGLSDYFDNIQRYVRGFKSRIAVKKHAGEDSEAGPSTKIEANDRQGPTDQKVGLRSNKLTNLGPNNREIRSVNS